MRSVCFFVALHQLCQFVAQFNSGCENLTQLEVTGSQSCLNSSYLEVTATGTVVALSRRGSVFDRVDVARWDRIIGLPSSRVRTLSWRGCSNAETSFERS